MNEPKKISFGFSKVVKKQDLSSNKLKKENVELIDCIEAKTIKVVASESNVLKKGPLVIPMKQNTQNKKLTNLIEIVKGEYSEVNSLPSQPITAEAKSNILSENLKNSESNLDVLAAQEIIKDLNKNEETSVKVFQVPLPSETPLTGEKESTLDDYENIPIADFGLAMLRGMGWEDGKGIGKNNAQIKVAIPELRPKGLGLGADRPASKNINTHDKDGSKQEELQIKKNAFVKIVMGKQAGTYGQIEGLDDDSGRLFVKMALGGNKVSLNEFMVEPVTKAEFEKNGKVLNSRKYEEYKKQEETRYRPDENNFIKDEKIKSAKKEENDEKCSISKYNEKQSNYNDYEEHKREKKYDDRQKKNKKSHKKHRRQRHSSEDSSSSGNRSTERQKHYSSHKSGTPHKNDNKYSQSKHRRSRSRERKSKDRKYRD